jgi:hypothetical protein
MIAADLIRTALINAGAVSLVQTIYAEDLYLGLGTLNALLAQWQRKRWLVWTDVDTPLISTGAATYTVMPGGDFDIARPDKLEAAFVRMLNTPGPTTMDTPLAIIDAAEDWAVVAIKNLSTFPSAVYYESAYPGGVLHVWPIAPAAQYEIHIVTKAKLPSAVGLQADLAFPPEYELALTYSLAVYLRQAYALPPDQGLLASARAARNTIFVANTQMPRLGMPAGASGRRGSGMAAGSSGSFQSGQW